MYRRLLLPVALALLLPIQASGNPQQTAPSGTAAPPADPAPTDVRRQVRDLVHEAAQLMDRGDRAGAADRLQQAQRLHPDPSLDYNLGIVYAEWGKPPEAAAALSRFLGGARKDAVTQDRLEDARRRLDAYRQQLAQLRVEVAGQSVQANGPAPAAVFLNRLPLGSAPLRETQWLRPGTYELRVSAPSRRDYVVTLQLSPGEERTASAQLDPVRDRAGLDLVPAHDLGVAPTPVYKKWWFWTAVGGGAVAVIGAALIGAGAAGKLDRPPPGTDLPPLDVSR